MSNWIDNVFDHYNSGACSTFCFYGNTSDIFFLDDSELSLAEYLIKKANGLSVALEIDPSSGIKLHDPDFLTKGIPKPISNKLEDIMAYADKVVLQVCGLPQYVAFGVIFHNAKYVMGEHNTYSALMVKKWSTSPFYRKSRPFVSLISDTLRGLHPEITSCQNIEKIEVPSPNREDIEKFVVDKSKEFKVALSILAKNVNKAALGMQGLNYQSILKFCRLNEYKKQAIDLPQLEESKKKLVYEESKGMLSFLENNNNLDALSGNHSQFIRERLRFDITVWNDGKAHLIPNGYLLCGPPGTGKTFFVSCLAGEGIPVVSINNFRGSFQGETESNLELVFRLLRALPRVFVFIDEADQSLGNRQTSSTDGGVSGRVYSMFAQEMSRKENRGKICWILATSQPHLLEPDLKRPGRIDLKIPLLPCASNKDVDNLFVSIAKKRNITLRKPLFHELNPVAVTPGLVDSILNEAARIVEKEKNESYQNVVKNIVANYLPPDEAKMVFLTKKAIEESSMREFVPEELRNL